MADDLDAYLAEQMKIPEFAHAYTLAEAKAEASSGGWWRPWMTLHWWYEMYLKRRHRKENG